MQPSTFKQLRRLSIGIVFVALAVIVWLLSLNQHNYLAQQSVKQPPPQETSAVTIKSTSANTGKSQIETHGNGQSSLNPAPQGAKKELIDRMSALAAGAGITEEVERAIREVASLGDSAIPELNHLVQSDQNANVRQAAARALAEIGTPQSIATLLDAVLSEQDSKQRRALVSSLHALDNPTPARELAKALLESQDPIVFPVIRDTLARVADATATRTIAQTFHSDAREGWQQSNLMGALLRVNSEEAVPGLREIVIGETDFSLRSQAAIALGRIGNQAAIHALLDALAQSQSSALTKVYTESLAEVNNKDSIHDLMDLLAEQTNEMTRYVAARALGNIPNETSVNALKSALPKEISQTVRQTIVASLNKLTRSTNSHGYE